MVSSNNKCPIGFSCSCAAAIFMAGTMLLPDIASAGGEGHGQYLARRDTIALGAGDAKDSNRAIHTIDPWPPYSRNDRLQFDGQRMWLGITRYQRNESIEPKGLTTQDISVGNSSEGGGPGGQ